MHPVILYFLGIGVMALLGTISLISMLLLARLAGLTGYGSEVVISIAGLIGLSAILAGEYIDSRLLVGIGLLLAGWIGLLILAIPMLFIWHIGTWCVRRIRT